LIAENNGELLLSGVGKNAFNFLINVNEALCLLWKLLLDLI